MPFSLHSPLVNVPLQELPIAAAALDRDSVVVAANQQFVRLCGDADSSPLGQRLADIVAECDRPALEEALHGLTTLQEYRASQRCSITALRAKPPPLWLAIDVARLGPGSVVAYLACLQAISRRRRTDSLPNPQFPARSQRPENSGSKSIAFSVMRDIQPWPLFLRGLGLGLALVREPTP